MRGVTTILMVPLLSLLSGCAMTTIHEDGSRQIFGLVSMTIPPATTPAGSAGETIEVSTVGLLLFSSQVGTGISFGYAREQMTGLRNNALLIGAPNVFPGAIPGRGDCLLSRPNVQQAEEGL